MAPIDEIAELRAQVQAGRLIVAAILLSLDRPVRISTSHQDHAPDATVEVREDPLTGECVIEAWLPGHSPTNRKAKSTGRLAP